MLGFERPRGQRIEPLAAAHRGRQADRQHARFCTLAATITAERPIDSAARLPPAASPGSRPGAIASAAARGT